MKYVYYTQHTWCNTDMTLMTEDCIGFIIFMRLKRGENVLFKKKNV